MSWKFTKFGNPFKGAEKAIEEINILKAIKIVAEAKSLAPVKTSRLKGSIQYVAPNQSGGGEDEKLIAKPKKGEVLIGTPVKYGKYQEFGTKFQAPQPFLRPAIALHGFGKDTSEVLKTMNKAMSKVMTKGKHEVKFF